MQIKFLQTCPSENPEFPFMAGQVIDIPVPSPSLLKLLDGVHAEAVTSDDTERAVAPSDPQPEPVRVKGRRRGKR